jgi:hypothetical protein
LRKCQSPPQRLNFCYGINALWRRGSPGLDRRNGPQADETAVLEPNFIGTLLQFGNVPAGGAT